MPTRKPSQTLIRTITGIILIILFAACMWASRYTAVLFFTAFGCIACVELANALHAMLIRSSPWPACILLVLLSAAVEMAYRMVDHRAEHHCDRGADLRTFLAC